MSQAALTAPESAPTAADAVFDRILTDIVRGEYPPQSRLPAERELARTLGASRPTLREALRRLAEWSLVESRRGSGVIVRPEIEWSMEVLPAYLRFGAATRNPRVLAGMLTRLLDTVSESFDYIIIDCPPSLGILTLNALVAADSVVVPMQAEYFALEGLSHLMNTIELVRNSYNPRLELGGVLFCMPIVRYGTGLSDQVVDFDAETGSGNAIAILNPSAEGILAAVRRAVAAHDQPTFPSAVERALRADLSWRTAAHRYFEVYGELRDR